MSESSTSILKLYVPTVSEHKLHKTGIENGHPLNSIYDRLYWENVLITTNLCSTANDEVLKVLHTHSESLGITLETLHYSETVQKFPNRTPITYSSVNPITEQKSTIIGLIIYKPSTHTKIRHHTHDRSEGKLSNPLGTISKS